MALLTAGTRRVPVVSARGRPVLEIQLQPSERQGRQRQSLCLRIAMRDPEVLKSRDRPNQSPKSTEPSQTPRRPPPAPKSTPRAAMKCQMRMMATSVPQSIHYPQNWHITVTEVLPSRTRRSTRVRKPAQKVQDSQEGRSQRKKVNKKKKGGANK